jgi:hypothetical protein
MTQGQRRKRLIDGFLVSGETLSVCQGGCFFASAAPGFHVDRQQLAKQPVSRRPGGVTEECRRVGPLAYRPSGLEGAANIVDPLPLRQR